MPPSTRTLFLRLAGLALLLGWLASTTLDLCHKLWASTWTPNFLVPIAHSGTFDDGIAVAVFLGWALLWVYLGFLGEEKERGRLKREGRGWREWERRQRQGSVSGEGGGEGGERQGERVGGEEDVVKEFWAVDEDGECVWVRRMERRTG